METCEEILTSLIDKYSSYYGEHNLTVERFKKLRDYISTLKMPYNVDRALYELIEFYPNVPTISGGTK